MLSDIPYTITFKKSRDGDDHVKITLHCFVIRASKKNTE